MPCCRRGPHERRDRRRTDEGQRGRGPDHRPDGRRPRVRRGGLRQLPGHQCADRPGRRAPGGDPLHRGPARDGRRLHGGRLLALHRPALRGHRPPGLRAVQRPDGNRRGRQVPHPRAGHLRGHPGRSVRFQLLHRPGQGRGGHGRGGRTAALPRLRRGGHRPRRDPGRQRPADRGAVHAAGRPGGHHPGGAARAPGPDGPARAAHPGRRLPGGGRAHRRPVGRGRSPGDRGRPGCRGRRRAHPCPGRTGRGPADHLGGGPRVVPRGPVAPGRDGRLLHGRCGRAGARGGPAAGLRRRPEPVDHPGRHPPARQDRHPGG